MKNIINIGIPSKGRLRKDVLKIFSKKKFKVTKINLSPKKRKNIPSNILGEYSTIELNKKL